VRLTPEEIAAGLGAEVVARGAEGSPRRATIDSAQSGPGDLFFGLRGANRDGGEFAADAIEAGAWGVVVGPRARQSFLPDGGEKDCRAPASSADAWVFAVADPLASMQSLARAWRRALGARVVGVTGSVGKTSVKDIARALLPGRVHANRENLNTEIGLPLTVLEAPEDTELLVLEMAMRGPGQIAELAGIAEPDVAVITNVGPVHVELLGSIEAIAAAKAAFPAWSRSTPQQRTARRGAVSRSLDRQIRRDYSTASGVYRERGPRSGSSGKPWGSTQKPCVFSPVCES